MVYKYKKLQCHKGHRESWRRRRTALLLLLALLLHEHRRELLLQRPQLLAAVGDAADAICTDSPSREARRHSDRITPTSTVQLYRSSERANRIESETKRLARAARSKAILLPFPRNEARNATQECDTKTQAKLSGF